MAILGHRSTLAQELVDAVNIEDRRQELAKEKAILHINDVAFAPRRPDEIVVRVRMTEGGYEGSAVAMLDEMLGGAAPLMLVFPPVPETGSSEKRLLVVAERDESVIAASLVGFFNFGIYFDIEQGLPDCDAWMSA
jgi:hypothetical protein